MKALDAISNTDKIKKQNKTKKTKKQDAAILPTTVSLGLLTPATDFTAFNFSTS